MTGKQNSPFESGTMDPNHSNGVCGTKKILMPRKNSKITGTGVTIEQTYACSLNTYINTYKF